MASKYIKYAVKYYRSNLRMKQFTDMYALDLRRFYNWCYVGAPKSGVVFDETLRKEHIKAAAAGDDSINSLVSALSLWIMIAKTSLVKLKVSPFDDVYRQIVVEIIKILENLILYR